jgi:3-dehydroquinate synthase
MAERGPVRIELPTYEVLVDPGALGRMSSLLVPFVGGQRVAIITDAHVEQLHARRIARQLGDVRVITIAAGEAAKTRETWAQVTDDLLHAGFGRDTLILAVGGGVVGDLAGFVAATYMRGVPFIQVPTTLLSMIDASVGGKTGVDTPAGKNLVGAFHQPALVIADPNVLATLPGNHFRAGLAEALKHGVIASAGYFDKIAASRESTARDERSLTGLIAESVRIKASVVARDEREAGLRKVLNFGHTIGHAIESVSNYALLHGEAVAIGMALESALAERIGVAKPGTADAIRDALNAIGLPSTFPALDRSAVLAATKSDKKARAGRVEYALPSTVGSMAGESSGWGIPVDDDAVASVLS